MSNQAAAKAKQERSAGMSLPGSFGEVVDVL
jgi:hypothetical protein